MTDETLQLPFPELLDKIHAALTAELPPYPLLTPKEVAPFFRVDPSTIYAWIDQGEFPGAFKWGGSYLIPRELMLIRLKRKLSESLHIQ